MNLLGRQEDGYFAPRVFVGSPFDLTYIFKPLGEIRQYFFPLISVPVLSASKAHADKDLVLFLEECHHTLGPNIQVVLRSGEADPDFLQLRPVMMRLFLPLLILELAVVKNSTYGWIQIRSHFDKVKPRLLCFRQGFAPGYHPNLFTILSN